MTKLIKTNQQGFTLIELMIVVAIIGILAAIAIPNFARYQLKSKTTEAKANLGGIKAAQEAYRAENDFFATCAANPAAISAQGAKQAWVAPAAGAGWGEIGFQPAGAVYYQYEVASANDNAAAIGTMAGNTTGTDYAASAVADLDKDGANGEFGYATDEAAAGAPPVATTASMAGTITKINTVEDVQPNLF